MRNFKLLILLLLSVFTAKAQQFGGNPPSITWKQVNTPAARVIFPKGMDSAGVRVANIVTQMNNAISPTIGSKQKQISIVLQNQTTISNGYVGLAPFRSEYFLTPEQNSFDLGSLHWTDQLAVHEFRHVQQYNNFNVGFSRFLHVLFGEAGQALGNELSVPNWFFEGDAVFNETYVTQQGRGRLPYFFNGYRALWAAGTNYSYMKLRNGSYQDYTPDHYPLGYMLVSYGRDIYGDDFWKKVSTSAAAFHHTFFPMQSAIKQYSGKDFEHFTTDAFTHYKQEFGLGGVKTKAKRSQHFIADQEYPAFVDDSTLIYVRSTYERSPVFVELSAGKEQIIAKRNYSLDNYFAYHDGEIVYAVYRPDIRWAYRDYSELYLLDIKTRVQTRITKDTKYFAPDFSADGQHIVTAQVNPNGVSTLIILGTDGKVIDKIPNPEHLFYTYPKFYGDKIISAVRRTDGGMTIAKIDTATGKAVYLLPFSMQPIAFPVIRNDKVYFSATTGKTEALFALGLNDKKLYQLQNDTLKTAIGNYEPTISGNKTAWVSFTAYGYKLHQTPNNDMQWVSLPDAALSGSLNDMGIAALGKNDAADLLASVKNEPQTVSKYSKAFHLFNFHSIMPTFSSPNTSFALQGENVLNTLQSQLLYNYNSNEGYSEFGFSSIYGGLFPYLLGGADYIVNRQSFYQDRNKQYQPYYFNETQLYAGFEIPLNLTKGRTTSALAFGSYAVYDNTFLQAPYNTFLTPNGQTFFYLNNFLTYTIRGRQPKKNIYPHFGDYLSIDYKNALTNITATQFLVSNNIFLPGLSVNHSIVLDEAFQQHDKANNGNYSNDFPFARGYDTENMYQMYKFGLNYHFPLFYPDAGFENAIYILRVRGNLFYDYMRGQDFNPDGSTLNINFRSAGAEVFFDASVWNQVPLTFGIRYSHLLDNNIFGTPKSNVLELVLPINVF